jgi:phage baseplate assembly protein gpV
MPLRRIHALLAALAALLAGAALLPPPASAAPGVDDEVSCTLRPNPRSHPLTEWATCVSVSADLSTLPAVGDTATLSIELIGDSGRAGVRVDADLVGGLEWVDAPVGFEAAVVPSANPADLGRLARATGTVDLPAGETVRLAGTIRATAAGPARVTVRGAAAADEGVPAGRDDVYLTVAEGGDISTPGIRGEPFAAAVPGPEGALPSPAAELRPGFKPAAAVDYPLAAPVTFGITATACATGSWGYEDSKSVVRVAPNFGVQVWDHDVLDGTDDLLATGVTDAAGKYTLCFDGSDNDGGLSDGGQDVFVRFISQNTMWQVQELNTGLLFHYDTATVNNLASGTHDFGFMMPGDPLHMAGIQAFDATNDLWNWVIGDCWDDLDPVNACPTKVINWRWDSATGTFYDPASKQVFLLAADPGVNDITVHEVTHAVMDDVYEFSPIPNSSCPNHVITNAILPGCAWVEGFAEWTPIRVYNSPLFDFDLSTSLNLETPTWLTPTFSNGANVESRVAGALIDISDSTNESPWDKLSEGDANIWSTLLNHKSNDFTQFWSQRTADGFNVSNTGGNACLYQNTIDFTFREPLGNNVPLSRPTPPPNHNYSFNTTTNYWSVVAVRPPTGADYDLTLFDNLSQTVQLSASSLGGSVVDFVAIDSNAGRRPLGDYYPRVTKFSGTGNFAVELAQGSLTLGAASSTQIVMASTKVVAVRDTNLTANVPVTIKVTPSSATQDAELFIVNSVAGVPSTFIRGRSAALKTATATGPGGVETITFTPTTSGWYGVVLVNKAGSGTYTLTRL